MESKENIYDYSLSKELIEKFRCNVCSLVPNPEKVICHIPCGQIFCESCLKEAIVKLPVCPCCAKEIKTLPGLAKDTNPFVYEVIKEIGKIERIEKEKEEEMKKADFYKVDCIFNCGEIIPINEVMDHLKDCPQNKRACNYCGKNVHFQSIEVHEDDCQHSTPSCPFKFAGCQWDGYRNWLIDHLFEKRIEHEQLVTQEKSKANSETLAAKIKTLEENLKSAQSRYAEMVKGINSILKKQLPNKKTGKKSQEKDNIGIPKSILEAKQTLIETIKQKEEIIQGLNELVVLHADPDRGMKSEEEEKINKGKKAKKEVKKKKEKDKEKNKREMRQQDELNLIESLTKGNHQISSDTKNPEDDESHNAFNVFGD